MKTRIIGICLSLLYFPVFSQTELSGVINKYAKIVDIDPCEAVLTTSSTPIFNVGDEVLLIQMQGAEINESNSSDYGDVTELGGAGLFERNEIADIIGTQVFLKYSLVNTYNATGSVQLVNIPQYTDAIVVDELTAFPWNGNFGGVLAFQANSLVLDANIDVSGQGFRGGEVNALDSDCSFLTNANDYHYSISNWKGAPKGEGIALPILGKEQGRGAQANGGGGGNDHNSGGGGGANITAAGEGGKQSVGGFGCDGDYPGERGKALENTTDRIFMGGGGGAGHADNAGSGSNGGNGGGIAMLFIGEIFGNGYEIKSNGETPNDGQAAGDGQGGGGAGGVIFLDIDDFIGSFSVEAKGGDGGNAANPSNRCFGPGGGGSGGRLISSQPITSLNLDGGEPGINTTASSECSDPSNSADAGSNGLVTDFTGIPFSNQEPEDVAIIMQPLAMTACEGMQVTFDFLLTGSNFEYIWQYNDGSGWQDVQPSGTITGVYSQSLTLFLPEPSMDGWLFRCFVTGPCTNDILSFPAALTVLPELIGDFTSTNIGGGDVQFTNLSSNATGYLWDFGDTETSMEENPVHTYSDFGLYTVSLTIFSDCGEITITETISVAAPPSAGFISDITTGCAPLNVQFINESSANAESWEWIFPGGTPATSFDENPSVIYLTPGDYDVTLIVSNTEGSDTLTQASLVQVDGPPIIDFTANINLLNVQFINLSQNATSGYLWDFGDMNTSTDISPEHTYAASGYYEVTLTAFNDCGETTITENIATGQFPLANFSAQNSGGCSPLSILFNDLSSGTNLTAWQWELEGGTPAVSFSQNPEIIYSAPGVYDVKLTVWNDLGEHSTMIEDYIIVEATPEVDFDFFVNEFTVAFNNTSIGGNSLQWNFGDGDFSEEQNPFHTYDEGGVYSVILNVSNSNCASAISKDVFIESPNAVKNKENENNLAIFPNPTNGIIHIQFLNSSTFNATLNIVDLTGRTIWEGIANSTNEIDLSMFPSGVYILNINNQGTEEHYRIIKN